MKDYDTYRNRVEERLLDYIPSIPEEVKTIRESMEYSLRSGGKRVRPVLLLAACDFAGGDTGEALPYACALEYIHTYSLIHDDLPAMDNDDLRRGHPTNHKVYGDAIAILAGDGLLNTAHEVMIRELTRHFDDPDNLRNHIRAALTISENAGVTGMIAGQVADIENEFQESTLEQIRFIDDHKTGALLTAPIRAGLYLANAGSEIMNAFTRYAENLGRAFQIADDILDAIGDEALVGKKTGKDAEQGKSSYVAALGLEDAQRELHALTENAAAALEPYGENASFFITLARKLERRNA